MDDRLSSELEGILIGEEELEIRVRELGVAVAEAYDGLDPLLVTVLRGGVFFFADLLREVPVELETDFMAISSYGPESMTGAVRIIKDLEHAIERRHVLIVEDIIDTGLTLNYLLRNLRVRGPKSLRVCTLLDRTARRIVDIPLAFRGFEIPDRFVIGYGLDYKQRYRNLPFIGVLRHDLVLGR
jgi:hypoxanthine phosphoribosyltransferase